jgi:hypothetical protein
MGQPSRYTTLISSMAPDALCSALTAMFDNRLLADDWDKLTPAGRMTELAMFLTQDGLEGDVVRDLFHTLAANVGAGDWIKTIIEN